MLNAQKEFDNMVENATEEDQAALKDQQFDIQEMMEQLREERKAAREEAQALREELEAQRIENEAKLMKKSSEWDAEIRKAESNPYFNGQIYALLEFSGITMNEKNIVQWSQDESTAYLESFRKYANIMDKLFVANAEGTEPGLDEQYGNNING